MVRAAAHINPGFLIRLSQDFIHKKFLSLSGYVLWRIISASFFLMKLYGIFFALCHRRLILRLSNIDLKATIVVCGILRITAKFDIMQFWCGFFSIKLATRDDFSFVNISLTIWIESGYVWRITLGFAHIIRIVKDLRMLVWAWGKQLSLHANCELNILLVLQGFTWIYINRVKSGRWCFVLWLSFD